MVIGAVRRKAPPPKRDSWPATWSSRVGDTEVQRPLDFQRAMLDRAPGETLRVTVRRAGNQSLNLTLGRAPEPSGWPPSPPGNCWAWN